MAGHLLERSLVVANDLPFVFSFFKKPENVRALMPASINLTITWASDEEVRAGTLIRYHLGWLGIPMTWESAIVDFRENEHFTDEMMSGPYAAWRHMHSFRLVTGGVEINDRVEYSLPLGPLGEIAHALLVNRQLNRIFDYRSRQIALILGQS